MRIAKITRKFHRVGAILSALPVLVVLVTGLVLQLKKDITWIQPATQRVEQADLAISFEQILHAAKTVPEAEIQSWNDIDRLDIRPGKGVVKIRAENRWEIQISGSTAEVLQVAYRRSDFFEELHDGSWFHDNAKLWLFLPAALVLLLLWGTGVYLWLLPFRVRQAKRKRAQAKQNA